MARTHRRRRRRGERSAKKFVALLIVASLLAAGAIWTSIIAERQNEAMVFGARPTAPDNAAAAANKPRNLIVFVGDGYGMVPMTAARIYAVGEAGELAIDKFPETAFVKTWSNDAQASDAAAAMSAYMTGVKGNNSVIASTTETRAYDASGAPYAKGAETTCPAAGNGGAVTTLLELAKAAGRSAGIVTTARVTHATAAATYAHLCHRDGENAIATQLVVGGAGYNGKLGTGLDVVLGGGMQHFLPRNDTRGSSRDDARDLVAEMRSKGYAYVATQAELAAAPATTTKLFGLFNRSHLHFDLERAGTLEPNLADMTTRAIDVLQKNPNGYFLMVEAGGIGLALQESRARAALQDAKAYDDAIAATLAKVRIIDPKLTNTLVVVLATHDATLVMNGSAALTGKSADNHAGVLGLLHDFSDPYDAALDADRRPFTTLVFGSGAHRIKGSRAAAPALTEPTVFDRQYRQEAAIETSGAVGGADVFLAARGLNAEQFHGVLDNTRVFKLLKSAVGL